MTARVVCSRRRLAGGLLPCQEDDTLQISRLQDEIAAAKVQLAEVNAVDAVKQSTIVSCH